MAYELFLLSIFLCFLFHCKMDRVLVTVILFFIRGLASGVFQAAYVYTPEVYPTGLRSVGVGACSGMARFGAMMTPYIAQVLMKASLSAAVSVYVSVGVIASVSCLLLPIETKGKSLGETNPYERSRMKWIVKWKCQISTTYFEKHLHWKSFLIYGLVTTKYCAKEVEFLIFTLSCDNKYAVVY